MTRRPNSIRNRLLFGASATALMMLYSGAASAQQGYIKAPRNPAEVAAQAATQRATLNQAATTASQRAIAAFQRAAQARQRIDAAQAAARAAAQAAQSNVPNGLGVGGLQVANGVATDPSLWVGATGPVQTAGADGRTVVTIGQTQDKAILSWDSFNVGRETDLTFNQQGNADWVALNRVTAGADPSKILGRIKADGTVLVINPNGVIFGGTAQVNTRTLIASSLDVGPQRATRFVDGRATDFATDIAWRNENFLQNGLLGYDRERPDPQQLPEFIDNARYAPFTAIQGATNPGAVSVEAGAVIEAGVGGMILLAAPEVVNAGRLSSSQGQVILAAGTKVALTPSTGGSGDPSAPFGAQPDADIRGLVAAAQGVAGVSDYSVLNKADALIEASQGNISLVAPTGFNRPGQSPIGFGSGSVRNDGALWATTSVSRNGSVLIDGTDIRLGSSSLLAITPDDGDESIPQTPSSIEAFKSSAIRIGEAAASISFESDSLLLAPGARVTVGATNYDQSRNQSPQTIHIDSGAVINLAGLTDVQVAGGANQIIIDPAKKNELRDSPLYRDGFLNGATIYLDPTKSGVRDDGVVWIGSPLIDAAAYHQLLGISVEQLMTGGGRLSLGTQDMKLPVGTTTDLLGSPVTIIVRDGAMIDISGGWTAHQAGRIRETMLISSAGRIVPISAADPNETYVGVYGGIVVDHTRWQVKETWSSPFKTGIRDVPAHIAGRDAGSLYLGGRTVVFDGNILGEAFAGSQQLAEAREGSGDSAIAFDHRPVQAANSELPAGGLLVINGVTDIRIADEVTSLPDGDYLDPLSAVLPDERVETTLLSDDSFVGSGLSGLSLNTRGTFTLDEDARIDLVPGGALDIRTGGLITIDGDVTAPSGRIHLETARVHSPPGQVPAPDPDDVSNGGIVINGDLSVAGRWVNDFGASPEGILGGAWLDGGAISMVLGSPYNSLAPALVAYIDPQTGLPYLGSPPEVIEPVADVFGSIIVSPDARLDLSGGGRIDQMGRFDLSAKGGDLTLTNEAGYFLPVRYTFQGDEEFWGLGLIQSGSRTGGFFVPSNPEAMTARVSIDPASIRAHGFGGGGTFDLTTPEFSFGDGIADVGTTLPLDFFSTAGFGAYTITSNRTELTPSVFTGAYPGQDGASGFGGYDAILATQTVTVGAGETLNLTQSVLPGVLDLGQQQALLGLASGGDVRTILSPSVPVEAWDQKAVTLNLNGLLELRVEQGGSIIGAAGSALNVGGLLNEGTIRIAGGTIAQRSVRRDVYTAFGLNNDPIAVRDLSEIFSTNEDGSIDPAAFSLYDPTVRNWAVGTSHGIYKLGLLDQDQGIVLAAGSVTDLSGALIVNPRTDLIDGRPLYTGRVVGGGTLAALPMQQVSKSGVISYYAQGGSLIAAPGATIDLSGVSATFDLPAPGGRSLTATGYAPTPVWSDGGTLFAGMGGDFSSATIDAHGGAAAAHGGTLRILNPVFSQHAAEASTETTALKTPVSADLIAQSGFDTLVALGSVTSSGDATIKLDRAFFLEAQPYRYPPGTAVPAAYLTPVISTGGVLAIEAPYIGLRGNVDRANPAVTETPGDGSVHLKGQQIDVTGSILFDSSVADAALEASGDIRLIGVSKAWQMPFDAVAGAEPGLRGLLSVQGDLSLIAAQIYPTTGSSFDITSAADDGTITIGRSGAMPSTPYSAGGDLRIQAANIVQGGVLRVPFGSLTLGGNSALTNGDTSAPMIYAPATKSVTLTDGSITSVSAGGLSIPYGTTSDTIEWYFAPLSRDALTGLPAKVLSLNGADITLSAGATVDLTGGGDVYAYEFVPGTGGSRDILSRFNTDEFSANMIDGVGYQYPDRRQVYAIVPGLSDATAAAFDPIYSEGYDALYGASAVGRRVYLDAAPGLEAGWYTLLPAKYALLPGGMRVVEQTGAPSTLLGTANRLADGSLIVSGRYGDAASGAFESQVRLFSVQDQTVVRSYSNIALTSGNALTLANAANQGLVAPPTGLDAGKLVLNPLATLQVDTAVSTAAAKGGRGAQVDISGSNIAIVSTLEGAPDDGAILLATGDLNNLNAESLLIGGVRTDNADGSTNLTITSRSILVANDAAHPLIAPEIVLVIDDGLTGDVASSLILADGATLTATGVLNDTRDGAYVIDARPVVLETYSSGALYGSPANSALGALFRVANGPERVVQRLRIEGSSDSPDSPAGLPASLVVGNVNVTGAAIGLDTSNDVTVASAAQLRGDNVSLGAGAIAFTGGPVDAGTVVITPELQALLSQGKHLTLRAQRSIGFDDGAYTFGGLTLDAQTLDGLQDGAVTINAGTLTLSNAGEAGTALGGAGTLTLTSDETIIGDGVLATSGFDAVNLSAAKGLFAGGSDGTLDVGAAALSLTTPYIGDRGEKDVFTTAPVSMTLRTTGAVAITNAGASPLDLAAVPGVPGSSLTLEGGNVDIAGTHLRATAGTLTVKAAEGISLSDGAVLEAPGYTQSFGDAADKRTASAPGGVLSLVAAGTAGIALGDATLSVGGGAGNAGTLKLSAANGAVDFGDATLDGKAGEDGAGGNFALDTAGAVDLVAMNTKVGADGFTGGFSLRSRTGDLVLAQGQTLKSGSVDLTADGGFVTIAGTIDTAGVNGGDIALYGAHGVTLESTAKLDAHATGYAADDSRQASAGDVTLGTDFVPGSSIIQPDGSISGTSGVITVANGAAIDVSAKRPGNRLVRVTRGGAVNYMYVQGDQGGIVSFRAPVVAGSVDVSVANAASVVGARAIDLEGLKRWDLAAVAASGLYSGVAYDPATNAITLDVADALDTANADGSLTTVAGLNFLGDKGAGTVVEFVQDYDVSADYANLGGLAGQANFSARPGVDLSHSGNITLASNWNLGAGIVDVTGAMGAGLMGTDSTSGQAYVIPGREADLLAGYTRMTYRVGASPTGAAPVVAFRAGGDLHLKGSLTDGFFQFRDQYDPTFQSYLNAISSNVTVQIIAEGTGVGMPGDVYLDWLTYTSDPSPWNNYYAQFINSFNYSGLGIDQLSSSGGGAAPAPHIPFSALGNSPAALTAGPTGVGDPLASAVVFPLLPDGQALTSADYRLTAGAAMASADPLRLDAIAHGNLIVDGPKPQSLTVDNATPPGAFVVEVYDWNYSLAADPFRAGQEGFAAYLQSLFPGLSEDAAVALPYASGIPANLQTFLDETLAADPNAQAKVWTADNPFGYSEVTLSLGLLSRFLEQYPDGFGGGAGGGGNAGTTTLTLLPQTVVRTGTGAIRMAASGDIDLTGGKLWLDQEGNLAAPPALFGPEVKQLGGAAVYTAGRLAASIIEVLPDPVTGAPITINAPAPTTTLFSDLPVWGYGKVDMWGIGSGKSGVVIVDPVNLTGGGDIALTAAGDVTGWRDAVFAGQFPPTPWAGVTRDGNEFLYQPWRIAQNDANATSAAINPQLFREGIGALGGGDIVVRAGGTVSDITLAADTSLITATATPTAGDAARALVSLGGGDVAVHSGLDILGARIDAPSGAVRLAANRDIGAGPSLIQNVQQRYYIDPNGETHYFDVTNTNPNGTRVRIDDATVELTAGRDLTIDGISWLDGFYSPGSTLDLLANGDVTVTNAAYSAVDAPPDVALQPGSTQRLAIYPGSLFVTSITGSADLQVYSPPPGAVQTGGALPDAWHPDAPRAILMVPSSKGQLSILTAGDIAGTRLAMLDADPNVLPGLFTLGGNVIQPHFQNPRPNDTYQFFFPGVLSSMTDAARQRQHNQNPTHADNRTPVDIHAGGDIGDDHMGLTLSLPKQARISAGRDILNMMFFGQNLAADDLTRIVAGRDIAGTTTLLDSNLSGTFLPALLGSTFILGGPGKLSIEAGRNLGPFLNSANTDTFRGDERFAGGILTVGNDWNPWLALEGASIDVMFGVGKGMDFEALREAYLDPANLASMPDHLFEQKTTTVTSGGTTNVISEPDRSKPIYGLKLIAWMKEHARDALTAAHGTTDVDVGQAYATFADLPELRQREFLLGEVYFGELRAPSVVDGPSYLKYSRGYAAVNTLFPAELGYTKNGLEGGATDEGAIVRTGDLDLRLAAIETLQGGDINIVGPGGRVLAGSVVSTAQQAARRLYAGLDLYRGSSDVHGAVIASIPTGYEGVITQRGGHINTFTDGDFLLNQSRLFTVEGGDITMWSSNADLNAGQGAKTTANFPPVVVRLDENGTAREDRTGSTTGAGIASFPLGEDVCPPGVEGCQPDVYLLAPRGTVDAGDAGVRVAGNISIAALHVANANNIKVQGAAAGIPIVAAVNTGALTSASAATSAVVAEATRLAERARPDPIQEMPTILNVRFLGFGPAE
ncbi:MAG: filamentous hemagglutinin family protein [Pseudomonadota bacterium]|nr:filamentous hemagglutinin family protein [Pseudomonadota bacterium]